MKQVRIPFPTDAAVVGSSPVGGAGLPADLDAEQWTSRCELRLRELRPGSEPQALRAAAFEMCASLRYFDPVMAAEMEHEGGMLHD